MDAEAFEAHLALHGLVRYEHAKRKRPPGVIQTYVGDDQLLEIFRDPQFVRIDQYGSEALALSATRRIQGFEEFGAIGKCILYTLENKR
jgi:hypothetical protein